MFVVTNKSNYLVKKLTSTTNININKRDNEFKSLLKRTIQIESYFYFDKILLYYKVDVLVDFFFKILLLQIVANLFSNF